MLTYDYGQGILLVVGLFQGFKLCYFTKLSLGLGC
jgi:hypothetical protein